MKAGECEACAKPLLHLKHSCDRGLGFNRKLKIPILATQTKPDEAPLTRRNG